MGHAGGIGKSLGDPFQDQVKFQGTAGHLDGTQHQVRPLLRFAQFSVGLAQIFHDPLVDDNLIDQGLFRSGKLCSQPQHFFRIFFSLTQFCLSLTRSEKE